MTRKDYIAIAECFHEALADALDPITTKVVIGLAREIASVLQEDNSRFDRYKFLSACGVESGW